MVWRDVVERTYPNALKEGRNRARSGCHECLDFTDARLLGHAVVPNVDELGFSGPSGGTYVTRH